MADISLHIQWRRAGDESGFLIGVDQDTNKVVEAWVTDQRLLTEFLGDMELGKIRAGRVAEVDDTDPAVWGDLVLTREEGGDVVFVDPQLYWESVYTLFRARGTDPHYWRRR